MIILAFYDQKGYEFTKEARFDNVVKLDLRSIDPSKIEAQIRKCIGTQSPNSLILLPCLFSDEILQTDDIDIVAHLFGIAETFKSVARGAKKAVFPIFYENNRFEKGSKGRKFIENLNEYIFETRDSGENPHIDRIFIVESQPFKEPWYPEDPFNEIKDNFLHLVQIFDTFDSTLLETLPLPRYEINGKTDASEIPIYGTFRLTKLQYPKEVLNTQKSQEDYQKVLSGIIEVEDKHKSAPVSGISAMISKPEVKFKLPPARLIDNWYDAQIRLFPLQILKFKNEEVSPFFEDFRTKSVETFQEVTKHLEERFREELIRCDSFSSAEDLLSRVLNEVDKIVDEGKKILFHNDSAEETLVRNYRDTLNKRKELGEFYQSMDTHHFNKACVFFLSLVFFPLISWISSMIFPIRNLLFHGVSATVTDIFMTVSIFISVHFYYRSKKIRLERNLKDAKGEFIGVLKSRLESYYEHVKDVCWSKQLKELRYQITRIKKRFDRLKTYTQKEAENLEFKVEFSEDRNPNLFFEYIMDTDNIKEEYEIFCTRLSKETNYKNQKEKWPVQFMRDVLTVPFISYTRPDFDNIFKNRLEAIRSDIDKLSGGYRLEKLVDSAKLKNRIKEGIDSIMGCPKGMFLDVSRGGNAQQGKGNIQYIHICQDNFVEEIKKMHTGFGKSECMAITQEKPEVMIGHIAINIKSKDFLKV